MAQERPNRLVEWVTLFRKQAPVLRQHAGDWVDQVREEPRLIWATPAVRYLVYGLSAVLMVWVVTGVVEWITPAPRASARPEATTADFHVVCTDRGCGLHFVMNREFGFSSFPVQCPRCEKKTGAAARQCHSETCRGRWVAPMKSDGRLRCPICETVFE